MPSIELLHLTSSCAILNVLIGCSPRHSLACPATRIAQMFVGISPYACHTIKDFFLNVYAAKHSFSVDLLHVHTDALSHSGQYLSNTCWSLPMFRPDCSPIYLLMYSHDLRWLSLKPTGEKRVCRHCTLHAIQDKQYIVYTFCLTANLTASSWAKTPLCSSNLPAAGQALC